MSDNLDQILDQCIDRLNTGASVEDCLSAYPEYAKELEPVLRAIGEFHGKSDFIPNESAKTRGRQQLLQERARIDAKRHEKRVSFFQNLFAHPKLWAPVTAFIIIALVGFGLSTMFIDDDSEPTTAISTPPASPLISPTSSPTITPEEPPGTSEYPSPDTPPATPAPTVIASAGILEIRVTDAPAYDISAVNVTISHIEVHRGGTNSAVNGWETIIKDSRTFELLELRGIEAVLGSNEIEAGHYTQIRMDIDSVTVTIDNEVRTAVVPSDKLRIVGFGSFGIEEGETTIVTLDIDAEKSVIVTGNGQVKFQPTVKVLIGGLKQQSKNKTNEPPQKGKQLEGSQDINLNAGSSSRKNSHSSTSNAISKS